MKWILVSVALAGLFIWVGVNHEEHLKIRRAVEFASNASLPHRNAAVAACKAGGLNVGAGNKELGLGTPESYAGPNVMHITAQVAAPNTVNIIIAVKNIQRDIRDGATFGFTGVCENGTITWTIDGTFDRKYLPKTWVG